MPGVHKQALNTLRPGTQNALVIGVIIGSLNVKIINSAQTKYKVGERAVWTFTLRDSEMDYINVTVWGSEEFVKQLALHHRIGHVVEVISPKVIARSPASKNEQFIPSVSSPCTLMVNEGNSLVQIHNEETRHTYESLLSIPIRSTNDLRSLRIISQNLESLRGQYVDVLVVVTFIGSARSIMTRDGRDLKCRNIEVADGSMDEVVPLMLWEHEWINRAAFWEPRYTALLLTDAQIVFDNYRKKIVLSIGRKTLITENPDISQIDNIRNAIQTYDPDLMSDNPFAVPDPDTITTVMSIQEITNKLNKKAKHGERIQFSLILKAYVMELNVDNESLGTISTRCALCKKNVNEGQDSCMNLECPSGNGTRTPLNVVNLSLKVNFKDPTGYLIGCRLTGDVAERVLGCSAIKFQQMTIPQRTELKWKYVLEKCEVRLHVLGPTTAFPNAIYNILSMVRIPNDNSDDTQETDEEIDAISDSENTSLKNKLC